MTREQKLVALCAFLPVLADFIEDLNDQSIFRQDLKRKANMLLQEIQRTDRAVLRIDEENAEQVYNEQIDLQRAFRQWIEESIKL
jgi:predicted urease superfamily metal-dependent hydrolase